MEASQLICRASELNGLIPWENSLYSVRIRENTD